MIEIILDAIFNKEKLIIFMISTYTLCICTYMGILKKKE